MDQDQPTTEQCDNCGSANLHAALVRSAFWHGDRLVVIEEMPAVVCDDCHEQLYDDRTMVLLDLLRGDGFPEERASGKLSATVFSFQDLARTKESV